jgi:hypothetical protein
VAGFDTASQPDKVRERLGLALQTPTLDAFSTGRETLELAGRLHRMPAKEVRNRTEELLDLMGLASVAKKPTGTYSGEPDHLPHRSDPCAHGHRLRLGRDRAGGPIDRDPRPDPSGSDALGLRPPRALSGSAPRPSHATGPAVRRNPDRLKLMRASRGQCIHLFVDLATEVRSRPPRLGAVRLVAIDWRSGSGKSVFARRLAAALGDAPIVSTDESESNCRTVMTDD